MSNIQRPTFNLEVKTKARFVFPSMLNVGRWTLDARFLSFLVLIPIIGCCPSGQIQQQKPDYLGPTDPMDVVIADVNRNNTPIRTLWTRLDYTATVIDPQKKTSQSFSGDGSLLYSRPYSLKLDGSKDVAGAVFAIGSNDQEFWVKMRTSADAWNYYWGKYENLGKPGCQPIPIRPDLIIEVLGVGLYGTNFLQQPVPVMRFDNQHGGSYIFDFNVRLQDRWMTQKEIWIARETMLPTKVLLYDENGRVVLRANLSDDGPINIPGFPPQRSPMIARHYDLSFPDSGTAMTFDLHDTALTHENHGITYPNGRTFFRPDPDDNNTVIQIDKGVVTPN